MALGAPLDLVDLDRRMEMSLAILRGKYDDTTWRVVHAARNCSLKTLTDLLKLPPLVRTVVGCWPADWVYIRVRRGVVPAGR